jgi:hypothetical protein
MVCIAFEGHAGIRQAGNPGDHAFNTGSAQLVEVRVNSGAVCE